MKLLYCQTCGDIIAPHPAARQPRWCRCKRHAVWWEDPRAGILRLWDAVEGPICSNLGAPWYPHRPRAFVLGITNMLLLCPDDVAITAKTVGEMIDAHEDSYLFKRKRSLIIRIRPGESGDTAWATLPDPTEPEAAWRDLTLIIDRAQNLFRPGLQPNTTEWLAAFGELEEAVDRLNESLNTTDSQP